MLKCPFCNSANEDGALFCEQCKSDLSAVAPAPAAAPVQHDQHGQHDHGHHAMPAHVPVAEVIDAVEIIEPIPVEEVMPAPPHHLTPVSAAAEVAHLAPPHHAEEHIPSAQFVDVPAEIPMPIPDPHPGPLPGMTPPLEAEAIATHEAAAAHAAHAAPPPMVSPLGAIGDTAAPAPAASKGVSVPAGAQPKLVVKRGQKVGFEFPIYGGDNYVGRSDDKPVDIDLEDQEPPERVWCSRQHALIHYDENAGAITVEDLNSSNGTFVNRERVYPGQPRQLYVNDTVQIGTVHLTLKV